jgi:hypothetical protein
VPPFYDLTNPSTFLLAGGSDYIVFTHVTKYHI